MSRSIGLDVVNKKEIFANTKKSVDEFLVGRKSFNTLESKLYFCSESEMAFLVGLKAQLEDSYTRKADANEFGIARIINLLNPTDLAYSYSIGLTSKYRTISKVTSVEASFDQEYHVWKNRYSKEQHEYAEIHELKGDAYEQHMKKMYHVLEAGSSMYDYVKENMEDIDVLICGYDKAKSYAQIVYSTANRKTQKHLSIKVPNILALDLAPYQKRMKVAEIVNKGVNAFGDVYFMKKEEEEDAKDS